MGQGLSCGSVEELGLFSAVQLGDLETVKEVMGKNSALVHSSTVYDRNSALHIAAENGQIEVLSYLLDASVKPDVLNRFKQTPLMLAAMRGNISCVNKLIEAGANILMFDARSGRTCLHYAAYYGHSGCLQAILSAASTSPVAASWGYSRFVSIRDRKGATPLHLAARQRHPECVHILLDNGALVSASTGGYGFAGSNPLHFAARGGSLDCIRELLAWGADRIQRDASGRIPYTIALRHHREACAALLNPSSPEPLVWPSSLKFIGELNQEAKSLLEHALMEANREKEKTILKGTVYSLPSPSASDSGIDDNMSEASDSELCCICFDQACAIEVRECGHRMCAHCTLALCCHNKPNPTTACHSVPVCPFCRRSIVKLVVAKVVETENDNPRKSWRSRNLSEGSSSFKGISFGKVGGRGSGRILSENEWLDKPLTLDT
ncbi:putative E3 ubiquitin-protein ligase XBAT31 isoform X1 [Primulina eburnea]|uniref:putative E3 ubiquitin-protein ligase XBAT31 isoform X1 n=1 Tax=Primulina eburnea TaxID=1245227 RepID=UPI003C6C1D18